MKQVSPFKLLANRLIRLPLRQARDLYERCRYQALFRELLHHEDANRHILNLIVSGQPLLISRIGHTEGRIVGEWLFRGGHFGQLTHKQAHQNAGIFPVESSLLTRFSEIYSAALLDVDLLGFWQTSYQARWLASFPSGPCWRPWSPWSPTSTPSPGAPPWPVAGSLLSIPLPALLPANTGNTVKACLPVQRSCRSLN